MTVSNEPLRLALRRLALELADLEDSGVPSRAVPEALRVEALRLGVDPDVVTDLDLTTRLLLLGIDQVESLRWVWPDEPLDAIAVSCVQALDRLHDL